MFKEDEHPRNNDGKFTDKNGGSKSGYDSRNDLGTIKNAAKKKMTPAEKIASVHIDFNKDNVLPELNEEDLAKVGSKVNKPVLLKKGVIDRNAKRHNEVMGDTEAILTQALYSPAEIFKGNSQKPYYTFVKPMRISKRNGKDEYGIALLDVDASKDNFEVVHWHWVNEENLDSLRK